jgi:hypothetical protein
MDLQALKQNEMTSPTAIGLPTMSLSSDILYLTILCTLKARTIFSDNNTEGTQSFFLALSTAFLGSSCRNQLLFNIDMYIDIASRYPPYSKEQSNISMTKIIILHLENFPVDLFLELDFILKKARD